MRLLPSELALANLKGEISDNERGYLTRQDAYAWLKELSNEDFGDDIAAWEDWVKRQKSGTPSRLDAV